MTKGQSVEDVMRTNLIEVDPKSTVREAARQMRTSAVGDVLVVADGKLKGIVTDRDLVVRCIATDGDPDGMPIGEVCSDDPVGLAPDDGIDRAVELMQEKAVRRLPVLRDGRPVGIVSLGDLAAERDRQSALGEISAAPPNA